MRYWPFIKETVMPDQNDSMKDKKRNASAQEKKPSAQNQRSPQVEDEEEMDTQSEFRRAEMLRDKQQQ